MLRQHINNLVQELYRFFVVTSRLRDSNKVQIYHSYAENFAPRHHQFSCSFVPAQGFAKVT